MSRIILHCDLNCFYASVELLSHPDLRDIPVAVCGDPASRHGIILAKNEPAKQFGVKIAIENMWQRKWNPKRCFHSSCSRTEEFCDYIDTIGSEWIVACLDLGHAGLVREDPARMIYILGHRLQALHVHDNDHTDDLHGIPLFHCMDFDSIVKALADVNYQGDFTYEAADFYKKLPRRAWKSVTEMMVEIGRDFIEKIEAQRKV